MIATVTNCILLRKTNLVDINEVIQIVNRQNTRLRKRNEPNMQLETLALYYTR